MNIIIPINNIYKWGVPMDFKQLEAYIKTIELKSFSKTAEIMYVSQPSISHYIRNLEKELDTKLIIRTTKEVKPTNAGKVFYLYAKNILALKEKAIYAVKNRSNTYFGEIEIHASSVPAQYILPDILVRFNKEYPNISFKIVQSDTNEVIKNVISQKCEIGVVGAKLETNKCCYEFIVSESLIIIAPPEINSKILNAKDLKHFLYEHNFIIREEGSATRYFSDEFLSNSGIKLEKLNIVACLSNTQSIIHAVSKGLGISIVSEIAANDYIKDKKVSVIKTIGVLPKREFNFVYKKDVILPPQINLLMKFVCEII